MTIGQRARELAIDIGGPNWRSLSVIFLSNMQSIRNDALEEAALVATNKIKIHPYRGTGELIAADIRALKTNGAKS